jgi:hypothetical protein
LHQPEGALVAAAFTEAAVVAVSTVVDFTVAVSVAQASGSD